MRSWNKIKHQNRKRFSELSETGRGGFNGSGRSNGGSIRTNARIKYENKKLGKMGAASAVRIIDPITVDVSKYLQD